jgi:hypothetical protein
MSGKRRKTGEGGTDELLQAQASSFIAYVPEELLIPRLLGNLGVHRSLKQSVLTW